MLNSFFSYVFPWSCSFSLWDLCLTIYWARVCMNTVNWHSSLWHRITFSTFSTSVFANFCHWIFLVFKIEDKKAFVFLRQHITDHQCHHHFVIESRDSFTSHRRTAVEAQKKLFRLKTKKFFTYMLHAWS